MHFQINGEDKQHNSQVVGKKEINMYSVDSEKRPWPYNWENM